MRFIKSYKIFESLDIKLEKELLKFVISNYTLNEDGSIDCDQAVNLSYKLLSKIPFKFNKINYSFKMTNNKIKSLENCPKYIGSNFNCSFNKLTSLEFGPEYVGNNYDCCYNQLTTLKGCVDEVYAEFDCQSNQLTSLEFCPMEVENDFNCSDNKLEYLDRSPMIKGDLYCVDMFETEPEFNGSCEKIIWEE